MPFGKLYCAMYVFVFYFLAWELLISFFLCILAELGDFNPAEHQPGYLSCLQLLVDQNDDSERRISELHKLHRGQLPADAEYNYLEQSKRLDFYGIDLHKATVCNSLFIILLINTIPGVR